MCFPNIPWTLAWLASGPPAIKVWSIHAETTIAIPLVSLGAYLWVNKTKNVPEPADW